MAKNFNLDNFFKISKSNISKLQFFFWKIGFIQIKGHIQYELQVKNQKKSFEPFLRKISKCLIFKNPALWLFYIYSPLTSCKKSEKFLEPFLRKLRYEPTNQLPNQPFITNNTDFIGPGWCQSKKHCCFRRAICRTPWKFFNQTRRAFLARLEHSRRVQRRARAIARLICRSLV